MNRRSFTALGAAAVVAPLVPALAQEAVVGQSLPMDSHFTYALVLQYHDASIKDATAEALIIHPRGKVDVAPGWTIERAMTVIWPQVGKWWGEPNTIGEFFALIYRDDPNPLTYVEKDVPAPTPRDGNLVAVISRDGIVEFGPQFDGDESDRAAWREMGRVFVKLAAQ